MHDDVDQWVKVSLNGATFRATMPISTLDPHISLGRAATNIILQ
jgi:hypothetical protein